MKINNGDPFGSGIRRRARGADRYFSPTCAFLAGLLLVAGCASKEGGRSAIRPGEGIAEHRQIATEAEKAMRAALNSLAVVSAQSNQCAPAVLSAFSAQVQRLQVDSLKLRARSQAMLARGDAYFERWHEYLARVGDPRMRALAQKQRPALEEGFHKVKAWSQESHEAFQPFLAGLRKVRNALEKDPASLSTDAIREWMTSARANGEHVERCLVNIQRELDSMKALLTLPGSASQSQKTP